MLMRLPVCLTSGGFHFLVSDGQGVSPRTVALTETAGTPRVLKPMPCVFLVASDELIDAGWETTRESGS